MNDSATGPVIDSVTAKQEIQDIKLSKAHLEREVIVAIPGRPTWTGFLTGWNSAGVMVGDLPDAAIETCLEIQAEFLEWKTD